MVTPDETYKAHLARLPIEIIEMFAEYISPPSNALLHLRTMNRDLNKKTTRIVKIRYFEDRAFMFNYRQSLDTLLQISKRPVFAKFMKRTAFSLLVLRSYESDYSLRRESMVVRAPSAADKREQRRKQRAGRIVYERLSEEQDTMQREKTDQRYIEQILTNFKAAGNFPAIVTTSGPAWGTSHYQRGLGYDNCCVIDREDDGPYRILHEAFCFTDYPITHLELGLPEFGVTPNIFQFRGNDPYLTLKTLRLTIGQGQTYDDESDRAREEGAPASSS